MQTLHEKEETKQAKEQELLVFKDSDPQILEDKCSSFNLRALNLSAARMIGYYRDAAIRLTENILILQGYFRREMSVTREAVNDLFGIDEDDLDEAV
jgi:hypothetical protein